MSVEDVAAQLDQAGRGGVTLPEYGAVTAVNTDGTVSVELGRGEINSVPAARSYWPRAVGDTVVVVTARQGPLVLCAVGAGTSGMGITVNDNPPPGGTGWEAVNVYARDGQLWGDRVTAAPPPSGTTVTAVGVALHTYRSGTWLRSMVAEQGDWAGYGIQTGLVTFAAGAFTPISGLTPSAASVTMHRRDTAHGQFGETPTTLWRASVSGIPTTTPTRIAGLHLGPWLRRNETATATLTAAWVAPFCAGTANSLILYSDMSAENVELDSLTLTITAA